MGGSPYAIRRISGKTVLPPGGVAWHFAQWSDAGEKIQRFIERSVGRRLRDGEKIPLELALVHRPDNDYNPNAVSISAPASYGGDRDSRFFGYFYDHQLREIGMARLPDLSEAAGGEISCTGIASRAGLELDLAKPKELARAIDTFLGYDGAPPRHHSQPSGETIDAQLALLTFPAAQVPVGALEVTTSMREAGRQLLVLDRVSHRLIGHVVRSYLLLEDERDRVPVAELLISEGVHVAKSISEPGIPLLVEWPITAEPNLQVDPNPEVYRIYSTSTLARYNPKTRKLWIEDSRLIGPALCYAARIGLKVVEIGLPRKPWTLDDEVSFRELQNYGLRKKLQRRREKAVKPMIRKLSDSVRAAGLERLLSKGAIESQKFQIMQGALTEPENSFQLHEPFVAARKQLFGVHKLETGTQDCRLCGQPGSTFQASVCTEPLVYCHQCLGFAFTGVFEDRGRAASALKMLGELEFNGAPMLEGQLERLHIDPDHPATPETIDKLLLLRFAIKRGKFPWTLLLEKTGLAEAGLRLSRGTLVRARDGHRCLSLGEKAVCDFLHQFGIRHDREPLYPMDADFNPTGRRRADWVLADGTFVELWGLPGNPAYLAKMLQKRQLAVRHNLRLIEVTGRDLTRLPVIFANWLPPMETETTSWIWSPVVKRVTPPPEAGSANASGRNAFNAAARRDRLERCHRAVELQELGLSSREIAYRLHVSTDSVKDFLRDGRFFSDPVSDQDRLQRARAAFLARTRGYTKLQFQTENTLTAAKANEAWRDADVIDLESAAFSAGEPRM